MSQSHTVISQTELDTLYQALCTTNPEAVTIIESAAGLSFAELWADLGPDPEDPAHVLRIAQVYQAFYTPKGWLREDVMARCGLTQVQKPKTRLMREMKAIVNAAHRPAHTTAPRA